MRVVGGLQVVDRGLVDARLHLAAVPAQPLLALALGQLLDTMLYGVAPFDLPTIAGVAGLLLLTAAAATIGPAWRAARVDPIVALRGD